MTERERFSKVSDYDDLIAECLSRTDIYPSKTRKGLSRHIRKSDPALPRPVPGQDGVAT